MKKNFMLVGIILLLIVPCIVPRISGNPDTVSLTFYSIDDGHINKEQPTSTRGTWDYMAIRNTSGWLGDNRWQCDALVKFSLSSIPSGVTIVSAKLKLYYYNWQNNNPSGRDLNLYTISSDWSEDTVTWNTQPTCDTEVISYATVPSSYGWMEWDVAQDVQKYVDGKISNYGWKITDENGWGGFSIPEIFFRTKEYGSYRPYLEVEYEADITVKTPISGDIWYKEDAYEISWESENAGNSVKIELYKSGSLVSTVKSSTSNDGSYSWTIPSSLTSSSYYKIKITSTSYSTVYDESNYFSIDERYITVNSPYSGSKWYEGDTNTITWSSKNAGSSVKIELYKSSSLVSTIASSTSNDGSYSWTIPSSLTSSSYYKIKITSTSFSSVNDKSNSFSIDRRYITVNSPSGGKTCYKGETRTITWNSDNAGNNVKIELFKNSKYYSTIASSTYNDGSYSWKIPTSLSTGSSYKIKITSTSNSDVYDYSNTYLTIKETWLQKWLWAIVIAVLVIFIIIGIGIRSHAKNKERKRIFEKEKKEIKNIIHKATSEKKIVQLKTKEKKKGEFVTDYNWHSINFSKCPRWLKETVKKYKSEHHPKQESVMFKGRHFRYKVNFGDLKGKYTVKRRLRHKHKVNTPMKKPKTK